MCRNKLFNDPFFTDVLDILYETPRFVERTVKRTNVVENEKDYQIEIAIPGLIKDDLEIMVEDNILSISHERDEEETFRFTNSFKKQYTLPDDITVDTITADVENGILTVTIPKVKKKIKKRVIKIN